jgi:hypothetical protein
VGAALKPSTVDPDRAITVRGDRGERLVVGQFETSSGVNGRRWQRVMRSTEYPWSRTQIAKLLD